MNTPDDTATDTGPKFPGPFKGRVLFAALGAGALGLTLIGLKKESSAMESQHWVMLFVFLVAGYALGRLWTAPAQLVGLP
jgi:hypothetical protein